jgi:hypothetical protein
LTILKMRSKPSRRNSCFSVGKPSESGVLACRALFVLRLKT